MRGRTLAKRGLDPPAILAPVGLTQYGVFGAFVGVYVRPQALTPRVNFAGGGWANIHSEGFIACAVYPLALARDRTDKLPDGIRGFRCVRRCYVEQG